MIKQGGTTVITTTRRSQWGRIAALAITGTVVLGANASSVTINSVAQRWPWNNKVDITYTVDGGQTLTTDGTGDVYCRLVFNAMINGRTYEIDGVTNIGASASTGRHTVTWTPPADLKVKATDCTMTASLYSADRPSGDDYMIIDLETGAVAFEGLLGTQDLSNDRYTNNAAYKKDYMVLRKIPKGVPYYAAPATNAANTKLAPCNWSKTEWTPKFDYYAGVFPVTKGQVEKLGLTRSWRYTAGDYMPADNQSWSVLRASTTNPAESIPAISSYAGTSFFQWLNLKTGNRFAFDLPTVLMAEIARRAGVTTAYSWNKDSYALADLKKYTVCNKSENALAVVDAHLPNRWGLFDTSGNLYEWCLDDSSAAAAENMPADIFTPVWSQANNRFVSGGGMYSSYADHATFKASSIRDYSMTETQYIMFRVYCIMK